MTIRFGIQVWGQHLASDDFGRRFAEHVEQVRLARQLGFDGIFFGEHFLTDPLQMAHQRAFLARLSADAEGMYVGTSVSLLALHNPVETAAYVATMDNMTGGRFILGVGLGYRDAEFHAFGLEKRSAARVFRERLGIVLRLLHGEPVTGEWTHCRLDAAVNMVRPVQRPHPPVWIAANNDRGLRRAAELGDAWLISGQGTLASVTAQLATYQAFVAELGRPRPTAVPVLREMIVADTDEQAHQIAQEALKEKYKVYVQWGQDKAMPPDDALDLPYAKLIADRFILGSPEQCVQALRPYVDDLGATFLILRMQFPGMQQDDVLRSIELTGKQVIPRLRSRLAARGVDA